MKRIILTAELILISVFAFCQVSLFGVDLTKLVDCREDVVYRKLSCDVNPYYTLAEYKKFDQLGVRFLAFDVVNQNHLTKQMKSPNEYTKELSEFVSNNLGNATEVFLDTKAANPNNAQYYWILKEKDKYIVIKLFYSEFAHRNNLRVFFYSTYEELNQGFEYLTQLESKHRMQPINTDGVLSKL